MIIIFYVIISYITANGVFPKLSRTFTKFSESKESENH